MGDVRRIFLLGLLAFVAFNLVHAVMSYGWSGELQTPPGAAAVEVSYTCGPPFGSGYVHGPATTAYPLSGKPCGQRTQYQLLTVIDVLLGVGGIALVLGWERARAGLRRVSV
jgi:hypothetical protein